jgi:hypothetical protein
MHDQDNALGLIVQNSIASQTWKAYGDSHMLDTMNRLNLQYMKAAVQAAVDDIYNAYQACNSFATFDPRNYIPQVPATPSNLAPPAYAGTAPLYQGGYNGQNPAAANAWTQMRTSADVNNYNWSADVSTYSELKAWAATPPAYPQYALPQPVGKITLDQGKWAQKISSSNPGQYGPNWVNGNSVRYGVSFVNGATNEETGICWGDWIPISGWAFAGIQSIPVCPTTGNTVATGRIIYRQFRYPGNKLQPVTPCPFNPQVVPSSLQSVSANGIGVTISDNVTTTWQDWRS